MSAQSPAGAAYTAGLPAEIGIRAGEEKHIALCSAAGAGYMWEATQTSGSGEVAVVRIELGPLPRQNDPPRNLPAPVMLIIGGLQPGEARWRDGDAEYVRVRRLPPIDRQPAWRSRRLRDAVRVRRRIQRKASDAQS